MATATSNSLCVSSSSTLIDTNKGGFRQPASTSPQCVSLPTLPPPPVQSQNRVTRTAAYCRKLARNVVAMATGDAPAAELAVTQNMETPEFLQTVQEAWEKVEDKYAVTSLAASGVVFIAGAAGAISAIDRLPIIPGVLEIVGIGYTGVGICPLTIPSEFAEHLILGELMFNLRLPQPLYLLEISGLHTRIWSSSLTGKLWYRRLRTYTRTLLGAVK